MRYLDARFSQPDWMLHPMQRFIRETDAVQYEELRAWSIVAGDPDTEYELFYVEADRERYEAAIRSVDSVRWYDLTPIDDGSFYVYICQRTREADRQWRSAFTELNLLVVPPIVYDSHADFDMTVVGASEDLQAMLDGLPADIDVTVDAIGEYDRRHAPIAGAVTDRQLAAVEAAVELGFYEVPRTAAVADVAAELGCAESTATALLQRAESSVMERLVRRHGRGKATGE
ncbi:helix-turn-helix domain-containing protein [Haloarcula sp. JP-L23]|uniref:helix-turn-helix domain-containing protein n=1 Tax=Haloarcula sp. JP-L23 TaxID=2716717 RepID=UPI00140EF168|nr:bacterio-opsin activator [Haloarcula sp. JP-L23]